MDNHLSKGSLVLQNNRCHVITDPRKFQLKLELCCSFILLPASQGMVELQSAEPMQRGTLPRVKRGTESVFIQPYPSACCFADKCQACPGGSWRRKDFYRHVLPAWSILFHYCIVRASLGPAELAWVHFGVVGGRGLLALSCSVTAPVCRGLG